MPCFSRKFFFHLGLLAGAATCFALFHVWRLLETHLKPTWRKKLFPNPSKPHQKDLPKRVIWEKQSSFLAKRDLVLKTKSLCSRQETGGRGRGENRPFGGCRCCGRHRLRASEMGGKEAASQNVKLTFLNQLMLGHQGKFKSNDPKSCRTSKVRGSIRMHGCT